MYTASTEQTMPPSDDVGESKRQALARIQCLDNDEQGNGVMMSTDFNILLGVETTISSDEMMMDELDDLGELLRDGLLESLADTYCTIDKNNHRFLISRRQQMHYGKRKRALRSSNRRRMEVLAMTGRVVTDDANRQYHCSMDASNSNGCFIYEIGIHLLFDSKGSNNTRRKVVDSALGIIQRRIERNEYIQDINDELRKNDVDESYPGRLVDVTNIQFGGYVSVPVFEMFGESQTLMQDLEYDKEDYASENFGNENNSVPEDGITTADSEISGPREFGVVKEDTSRRTLGQTEKVLISVAAMLTLLAIIIICIIRKFRQSKRSESRHNTIIIIEDSTNSTSTSNHHNNNDNDDNANSSTMTSAEDETVIQDNRSKRRKAVAAITTYEIVHTTSSQQR